MADTFSSSHDTRASTGEPTASDFVYAVFIRADIDTVWNGLIDGELTRRYWGHENRSTWKQGAPWEHVRTDAEGTVDIRGRVIEIDPPTRMVWSWAFGKEADTPEKRSRVTYELVALGPDTKLTVRHAELEPGSPMDQSVREGWPAVLSNLKSILETGEVLREDDWPTHELLDCPET
ncbi:MULTISPECIES: SRPBCC family protein [unclassified Roseovarius]|uniref:SRPBCC family protein n=1 Tax=unclassified Roseovarius TaxID=2614913 RepID=UPI00273F7EBE|nr:SRPBCC family protein [Roseovarius sp. MMSF_3350]